MSESPSAQLEPIVAEHRPSPPPTIPNEHLSFPIFAADPQPVERSAPEAPRQILQDRLYIGNLHPSVDEYSLLQIFSKFGKVTKLDFLFHKTGLLRGKPRGYAFIEYGRPEDATKALSVAHDKLLRGRKLVVTHAHQAPVDSMGSFGGPGGGGPGSKYRKGMSEAGRPTALSLLKSGSSRRESNTQDKIAMMEAKLRQMESASASKAKANNRSSTSSSASTSTMIPHPSLPPKPIGAPTTSSPPPPLQRYPSHPSRPSSTTGAGSNTTHKPRLPPHSLASSNAISRQLSAPLIAPQPLSTTSLPVKMVKQKLVGVKINKPKQPKPAEATETS